MKNYIFTLTDESKADQKLAASIQAIISDKGGFDIQHLVEIGCITANFSNKFDPTNPPLLKPLEGVLAIEESLECTTQN